MERILDSYIREPIPKNLLSAAQHAYQEGKSAETALHEITRTIKRLSKFLTVAAP